MSWIGQKLELQIFILKPNLIIKDPKRIGLVALQRIAILIISGKFKLECDPSFFFYWGTSKRLKKALKYSLRAHQK
jgi:hypothetical protein